jgi:hypothetical protein
MRAVALIMECPFCLANWTAYQRV